MMQHGGVAAGDHHGTVLTNRGEREDVGVHAEPCARVLPVITAATKSPS